MDLKAYKRAKVAGNVSVARLRSDTAVVGMRQFSAESGVEVDPAFEQYNIPEMEKQLQQQEDMVTALKEFIADLKGVSVIAPLAAETPKVETPADPA